MNSKILGFKMGDKNTMLHPLLYNIKRKKKTVYCLMHVEKAFFCFVL